MFKCYQMNWDGTNYAAVHARTKKKALELLGTTAYQFKNYGNDETYDDLPSFGEVYYRPISLWGSDKDVYPWRLTRYRLRHDDQGSSYYE
jgi:hypothetical protein